MLEALGLTYESKYLDFSKGEQKAPEHTQYNPNGRIPTLVDHQNGDFTIWESDAILLYLTDKYDPEKRLTVTDEKDKYALVQWLFFQASGQGCVSLSLSSFSCGCLSALCRSVRGGGMEADAGRTGRTSGRRSGS